MYNMIHKIDDFFYLVLDLGLLFHLFFSVYGFHFQSSRLWLCKFAAILGGAFSYRLLQWIVEIVLHIPLLSVRTENDILEVSGGLPLQQILMFSYSLVIFVIFCRKNLLKGMLTALLYIPLCDMLRIMSYDFSRLWPSSWNQQMVFGVRTALSFFFLILFMWILKKYFNMLKASQKRAYWVYTGIVALCLNLSLLIMKNTIGEIHMLTLIFSLMLIVILLCLLLVEKMVQNYNHMLRMEYQTEKEEKDRQTLTEIEQATAELRKWRHEYQNQLLLLKSYFEEGSYEELKKNLDEFLDNLPQLEKTVHTGTPELDMVLNHKLSKARRAGIDIQVQIALPKIMPFERKDLFSLLNNLLNNSMEAVKGTENPYIQLTINSVKGYLVIQVRNTCTDGLLEKNPELKTQKPDKFLHGMGIPLIRSIAEKYNGIVSFSQESDIFQSKVLLSLATQTLSPEAPENDPF